MTSRNTAATNRDGGRPARRAPRAPPEQPDELVAPAKALRLHSALGAGLDELNRVHLDDAARGHVAAVHRAALIEVASTVSDALIDELVALGITPLDQAASVDLIKVAQAQLLGWVEGLLVAQVYGSTPVLIDSAGDAAVDAANIVGAAC